MRLVIDIQGFKIENNKFIVKEFAAYDGYRVSHHIFKPPFPLRMLPPDFHRQAIWIMNNHHCIDWNIGFTPLHRFGDILQDLTRQADMVYVKGAEKTQYIRKYSAVPVYEFDEQPALQPMKPTCFYHEKDQCICAISNVFLLYDNFLMKE